MISYNKTLARCPLCDSRANLCEMESGFGIEYAVVCNNRKCRLSEPPRHGHACKTEKQAIYEWNTKRVIKCSNKEVRDD
jgi:hypothetical protein